MKTQLLCTFTTKDDLQTSLQEIRTNYKIVYNYIYVLQNKGNLNELFVTYNIDTQYQPSKPLDNTILVHRKKQSNTLYTINALNELVKEENNGVLDKSFTIEWENFQNTLLLTNENGLQKIITKIHTVVNTRNWEESHFNR